ncbi:MAG: nucleotidyltransferase domain-containing protein [Bacteroidales bacterium]
MDKREALKISRAYLKRVRKANFDFAEAWLFGSFARGNQHENSDIDIAIVLNDSVSHTFETDVQLMVIRQGNETIIEPHVFSKEEFNENIPIVSQIVKFGKKIG